MKYKKLFFFIIAGVLLFNTASFADSESEKKKTLLDMIDGSVEYRVFPYFHRARGDDRVVNEVSAELRIRRKLGDYFDFLAVPRFIMDDDHLSHGAMDDLVDKDIRRNIINLKEWHLRFKKDYFSASAGKQIFSWGTADMFNPTDNLNPRDFTDFIENEKIGVPSVSLDYFRSSWKLEFIFIPLFTPTRLPLFDTRWSPVPEGFPLPINQRDLPAQSMKNAQYATRASITLNGWDFSVSYFDGFESVPAGQVDTSRVFVPVPVPGFVSVPTGITPVYDKVRIIGGDFSTTFDKFEIHGESAYYRRDNNDRNSYLQYIFGFNYTIDDIISDHDVKLTLEYAREEIVDRADNPGRYIDFELSHVFRNSLMGKIVYEFDYRKKIQIGGIYNINHHDYLIQPKFCYRPTDNWDIETGFDILGGGSETLFGRYSKNDRFFAKAKYSF
jgi:hypothetical protein